MTIDTNFKEGRYIVGWWCIIHLGRLRDTDILYEKYFLDMTEFSNGNWHVKDKILSQF